MMRSFAVLAAALLLAACGGGGAAVSTPPKSSGHGTGVLAFSIVIPVKPAPSAARRKPAYVSAATQSVSFAVGASTPQVVTLALGSPSCPLGQLGYTCTADASVAAGANQSLTIKTFASTDGSGPVLSQNTVVITVVAGQTNPVTVSLNGVAASLALAVSGPVSKCTPSSVTVTWSALDASGYTIIGPGTIVAPDGTAVAPTLAVSDAIRFTVGAPAGNSWNVAYNGAGGTSPVTLTASNPGVTAGTAPLTLNAGSLLFMTAANTVRFVAPPYSARFSVISNGVFTPVEVAVDPSCTLYVANFGDGGADNVTTYVPPYTGAPVATIPATNVTDMALSSTGNLFVLNGDPTDTVTEFAPPYTGAPIATVNLAPVGTNFGTPVQISADSANDFFVVSSFYMANFVRAYSPPYSTFTLVQGNTNPQRTLEQAGTNNLFITSYTNAQLEYAPPYTGGPIATISPGESIGGGGLALDAAGDFFVAYSGTSQIAEYQPPYIAPAVTITSGVNNPVILALDPATGNLFASNVPPFQQVPQPKTVTVYAPPYTSAPFATQNITGNGALAISP